jgi:putative ABC transport system permease protein
MLKNSLNIAIRNLRKNRNHSLVNITGLALGMACAILIGLYVKHELSYDRFHNNADRIFRAVKTEISSGKPMRSAISPNPLGPSLRAAFPEVAGTVRISSGGPDEKAVGYGEKSFFEEAFFLTDPSFFQVFTFPLLKGDPRTALSDPWSVVITQRAAEKYFGDEDPLGKQLTYENTHVFTVTGVIENIPENSHFHSDFFASMGCADDLYWDGFLDDWTQSSVHTYILLRDPEDRRPLEGKITAHLGERLRSSGGEERRTEVSISLQPLTPIHLGPHMGFALGKNGDVKFLTFYTLIGIIILLVACVNFMNISTARASTRTKEVGMRKVIGAGRPQLIRQFLLESVVLSIAALPAAALLAMLFLPSFGRLLGVRMTLSSALDLPLLAGILAMTALVGIVAGSYPAFILSSFTPARALRGKMIRDRAGLRIRSVLVSFQFIVSISLIICLFIIFRQVHFLRHKDLGFDRDNVLAVQVSDKDTGIKTQFQAVKNELLKSPGILGVTATSNLPHRNLAAKKLPIGPPEEGRILRLNFLRVDPDFASVLDAGMMEGRFFSKGRASDQRAFVINEAAADQLGDGHPLDITIPWLGGRSYPVIGVIKNFHFRSLHSSIEPMVLYLQQKGNIDHILIKVRKGAVPETIASIGGIFKTFNPGLPLRCFFIDEDIDRMYRSENSFMRIFGALTLVGVFIAFLGLFGLVTFSIQQRLKEISVRKVLGASQSSIIVLLSTGLFRIMLAANLIAWPLSYYLMDRWLSGFAYRVGISASVFAASACFAAAVAVLILWIHAAKAAAADPVKYLKYE